MFQPKNATNRSPGNPLFGLAAAGSFSVSAVLIRSGLNTGATPLSGLWIGFAFALSIYIPAYLISRKKNRPLDKPTRAIWLQISAGVAIAFGMWFRYIAMNTVPIGAVTALGRLNIPLILLLSPLFLKTRLDATSPRLWLGSLLIVGGATVIVLLG